MFNLGFFFINELWQIFAVEHSFSILHGYIRARECADFQGSPDITGIYFQSQFPQVREVFLNNF